MAALVFTGGCNLTCPYCHNGGLVLDPEGYSDYPLDELLADLEKRKGFIDGVVISGGEPTIDSGLPAFLTQLKALGFQIKLDSNGLLPEVIADLLERNLLDYVAIDLKTAPSRYGELHNHPVNSEPLRRTVELLSQATVEVEYRTTCIPELVGEAEIDEIGDLLKGAPLWVLQQYVAEHAMVKEWQELCAYAPDALRALATRAGHYVEEVQIRGL